MVESSFPTELDVQNASARAERFALRIVQLGAIAAILAASIRTVFELDRFLVPKELALHLTAALATLLALRAVRRMLFTWIDLLLAVYLVLGIVSALTATNPWLAGRSLAVTASGIALFWTARGLRAVGLERPLLNALALAVVLAAVTSLLQTYGIRIDLFSLNRAPGGTLGNRNFVAHIAAFGLPIVLLTTLRAQRASGYLMGSIGVAIVTAALVLTRSRAAWLASAVVLAILLGAVVLSGPLRRDGRTWRRLAGVIIFAGGAVTAALLIPNTLRWRSDNPYLDSVAGVANYEEGSGRGRLLQYERSLRVAARYPLFGVGPGNWPVAYPDHAPRSDPSLDRTEGGMTSNPWPSSDWIAFATERGFFAAILIALVLAGIGMAGLRGVFAARDTAEGLTSAALLATTAAAVVTGMFDAVLLLAVPSLLVWSSLGALWSPAPAQHRTTPIVAVLIVILCALAGAARSAAQLVAMEIYATTGDRTSLARAAQIDPGSYRVHLRLARGGGRQRCDHARAARALFPHADAARDLSRGCH
jgi:hypothetical protein